MEQIDRNAFIMQNKGLVVNAANKYYPKIRNIPFVEFEDLVQIGVIGLIKAYDRFDTSYGVKFSTYAVAMIDGEIKRFLRDNLDTVKFTRSAKSNYYKIKQANLLTERPELIAEKLEMSIDDVKKALEYYYNIYADSLDKTVYEDEGKPITLADKIGYEPDFDSNLEVELFLSKLDERTRKIVELRLQNKTQVEIGKIIGISQVQISRILGRLKKQLREGGIEMINDNPKLEQKEVITEKKKPDYKKAKELAENTDLKAKEIQQQTGVAYVTVYNYLKKYRKHDTKKEKDKTTQDKPELDIAPEPKEIRVAIPEEPKKPITSNEHITMTLDISMTDVPVRLGEVLMMLEKLGYEALSITIEGKKIA